MFTGLIETKGVVFENLLTKGANKLIVSSTFDEVCAGESIAVNGVCLTVLPSSSGRLHFDVSPETLELTTLGSLTVGSCVNLERALSASARFGGHYVSGHVDTTARVSALSAVNEFIALELDGFTQESRSFLIPKGSISVDGVSLTINTVHNKSIQLMLVPHTLSHTTLGALQTGQHVNIEFDYLTRIIAHQMRIMGEVDREV